MNVLNPAEPSSKPAPSASARHPWLVPTALVGLGLVPIGAGLARVAQLVEGVPADANNARFVASPLPVVLHVIGATLFCLLGALQLAPTPRPGRWHRIVGRVALPAAAVAALSGLWMSFVYSLPVGQDHALLKALRLVLGVGMLLALTLGFRAVRRRDFRVHRAWMVRSYAIGIGAGTQALLLVPWSLLLGAPSALTYALLMGAGWGINLVVAERVLRGSRPSVFRATASR